MGILLPIHILGAGLALVSGVVALSAAKGGWLHRKSGLLFVGAIATMCAAAVVMAVAKGQTVNVIAALLTAYLVITALTTVRPPSATSRRVDLSAMLVAFAVGLTALTLAFESPVLFMFAAVGLLGGAGDLRVLKSGPLRGRRRLARHLWRMCFALWIATASFFTVRARVAMLLPEPLLTPAVRLAPLLLVVLVMLYWLWRVRVRRTYRGIGISAPEVI